MNIRILRDEELVQASGLSRFVFDTKLRNRMEFTQTIPFVEEYISESNLKKMYEENRLVVFGAYEQEQLVGVAGLQPDGMITMLYVLPQYAGRNCGMKLLAVIKEYAKTQLQLPKVYVNATPAWTAGYFKKYGFQMTTLQQNMRVPFVPMYAKTQNAIFENKEKISAKTIILAALSCVGIATIASVWFMISYLF